MENTPDKKATLEQIEKIDPEITDRDLERYFQVISTELTDKQKELLINPPQTYPRQDAVLAVHWHPEFVPFDVIRGRIENTFPNKNDELIIPTQHNILTSYDGFTGVEVDCYSPEFNRKVQLLLHFERSRLEGEQADVLKAMLAHTFKYRSGQLFSLIDTILSPSLEEKLQQAATATGATEELIAFVRAYTKKISEMLEENYEKTPLEMIKNKILRNYFDALRDEYDDHLINRAQFLIKAIKKIVKRSFDLTYFYKTNEVIEEARNLGAGIVVPHPEQFWPVLLAEYDLDGYEVWNPQSQEFTEFLIKVVVSKNETMRRNQRPLLIFMGDDCHMGEKVKELRYQDPEKAGREIGVQPAWDDLAIRKSLITANVNRRNVIEAYRERLAG